MKTLSNKITTHKLTKEQITQIKIDEIVQKKIDEIKPMLKNVDWNKLAKF